MVFSSLLFMFIYLPVVLLIYYAVPPKWRNLVLFVVNLIFYGWGEPVYLVLMIFTISLNYFAALIIDTKRENKSLAKTALIVNTVVNLALLGFFKYYDLFAETLNLIPGISLKLLNVSLPIGISFYTFQSMSYPIDVYRGDTDVQKNYISFGTFVALFPQLIAGPIVRYKDVANQLSFRAGGVDKFASGVRRFTVGLGKKVLIANNIGMLWDIYAAKSAAEMTVFGSWLGIVAFSLQIYFDFSGYSDMAIGLGRMIGFEFLENFDYPYISKSVTEFWRRWHMSLGTWFRDYVYIPLGGNRKGLKRQFFNIFVVWALTGFWHGANWNFLGWGIYYAVFLMIEKAFLLKWLDKHAVAGHIYAIVVAIFGWVLFQLESLSHVALYYKSMLGFAEGGFVSANDLYQLGNFAVILVIGAIASTPLGSRIYSKCPEKLKAAITPILLIIVLVLSTAYLVDASYNPFLYFRF